MKTIYKILIIVGLILTVTLGFYLVWSQLSSTPSTEPERGASGVDFPGSSDRPDDKSGNVADGNPPIEEGSLKKISELEVFDFWVVPGNSEIYYLTPEGKIYAAKQGPDTDLSLQAINALNVVSPSPNREKILASFGDPQSPQWAIFDSIDRVWRPLTGGILTATWGEDSDQIIAIVENKEGRNLVKIDIGQNPPASQTLINNLVFNDINLVFQSPQNLFLTEKPAYNYEGRVWRIDLKTLLINTFIDKEAGLMVDWSADRHFRFHYSLKNKFYVVDERDGRSFPGFFTTWPSKCVNQASTTYCFTPEEIPSQTKIPDDYLQRRFYSVDNLMALDQATGSWQSILESNVGTLPALDAYHPQYLNGSLYFVNRYDNSLYQLLLK